jgi:hypothetical protein
MKQGFASWNDVPLEHEKKSGDFLDLDFLEPKLTSAAEAETKAALP